ncbi:MAG: ATP synthase F1 subunit delta [Planctomycetaceae bacterium]|nr:ATP synthase F1 subunit delta [Planctomycetaceae bacterium]
MNEPQDLQARLPTVMEDPGAQQIARVYADAFLDSAASSGVENVLEEFTSFQDEVIQPNPEFWVLLTEGVLSVDERLALIDRAIAPVASEHFASFLKVLTRHGRMDLLPLILQEAHIRYELRTGRQRVTVTSAVPLSDEQQEQVRGRIRESFEFEPILEPRVDATVLGGLIVQIGDTVYDGSLRTRMKQLRNRLRQRSLHEIQSGRNRFSHPEGD